MKKLVLIAAAATGLSGCIEDTAGTLHNQDAFGRAAVLTQTAQLADQTAYLNALSAQFRSTVPTTINFAFNRSALDAEAKRVLDQQAAFIRQYPNIVFSVAGHTDEIGSEGYNSRLGRARARAAVNYLLSTGVSRNQLKAVVSRGEREPVIASGGRERLNRRAVTDVMGRANARRRGHGMDGKRALIVYNEYVNDEGTEIVASE